MEIWKRNLLICCIASFIVMVGIGQLAPILPLYVTSMGITETTEVERWSGIIFGSTFITLAIFSPIWGRLSDKYGRKAMALRATLSLALVMIGMGLAQNVYQLACLRFFQGGLSGFQSVVIPLIAQGTPASRSGWAMGIYFASQVSGTLLGPILGGLLAELIGFRHTFFCIGGLCLAGFCSLFFLKEDFKRQKTVTAQSLWDTFKSLEQPQLFLGLIITTFIMQFAIISIEPLVTVYVKEMGTAPEHLALIGGTVFSCTGLASMLTASKLGKLADRIGSPKVLLASLLLAGFSFIPQGFARTPVQFGSLRFILGIATSGLLPSVNNIIRQNTPGAYLGRIYGLTQSAQFLGMFAGSVLGGSIAGAIGIHKLFFLTAALLLINALWCRMMICRAKTQNN